MQAILIASTLAVGLASSDSSDGAAPTVAEILAAWSHRAESVPCGRMSWTIPAEGWNVFGRFDTQWVPASGPAGGEMAGTVVFDQQQARYDSRYLLVCRRSTADSPYRGCATSGRPAESTARVSGSGALYGHLLARSESPFLAW